MARKIVTEADRLRTRRNTLLGCAAGCLGVVLLMVILVIVAYVRFTATPPAPSVQVTGGGAGPDSPAQRPVAPTAPPLDEQVRAVGRAAQGPAPQPVAIVVSPDELRNTLATRLQGAGFQEVQVAFDYGKIVAQGRTDFRGRQVYATVDVQPRIENGDFRLDVTGMRVGSLPVPGNYVRKLQDELDKNLNQVPLHDAPVHWNSLDVTPMGMTVQGVTVPGGRR